MKSIICLFLCFLFVAEVCFIPKLSFGEELKTYPVDPKEKKIRIIFDNTELEKKMKLGKGDFSQFKWQYYVFWGAMFSAFAYIYINRDHL
ncbi:MAG: hypothetical protein NT030_05825 [Candidatus Saganbacteria bacterium]|nr:hypothetical protein [Candidatus Saganbacteria bacterium]